jgi:hypothetical protein
VRPPGGWGRRSPAKAANEAITDSGAESVTITVPEPQPSRSRSASVCEHYRELIELGLSRGRNAKAIWQIWSTATVSLLVTKASSGL